MIETKLNAVSDDVKTLLTDASALFHDSANMVGDKADQTRREGLRLIDISLNKVKAAQERTLSAGKDILNSTDERVKSNPWASVGIAGLGGLVIGMILARRL